jgi:putative aldouronate transport system substrate-binding protein
MIIRKRFISMALFAFVLTSFLFAGGGQQPATSASGTPVLTLAIPASQFITDFQDNSLTKYLENLWSVKLDMQMLPSDGNDVRTRVALLVASNDLPDILVSAGSLSRDAVSDYGQQGFFQPLENYFNNPTIAPNFAKIPQDDKGLIVRSITSVDGHIYSLPRFDPESWNFTSHRYYINKAWLDKLGLQIPTTTDQLRPVLTAFRDRDPNRNGIRDEIPALGFFSGGYGENIVTALINSFIFYNMGNLSLDDAGRTVIAPFTQTAFRQAIIYINGLFRDDLLSGSTFTINDQEFTAMLNTQPSVVGLATLGSHTGRWPAHNVNGFNSIDNNPNFLEMALISPFIGPQGVQYTPQTEYLAVQAAQIARRSRNPELAFKVMESMLDIRVGLLSRVGVEGVHWSDKPEDIARSTPNVYVEMGVFPRITRVLLIPSIWAIPNNVTWRNQGPRYAPLEIGVTSGNIPQPNDPPYNPNSPSGVLHPYNHMNYLNKRPQYILPALNYTVDEMRGISESITNVNEYVRQSLAEFITNTRDINNDTQWNAYLRELNNMGLQRWIDTAQTAYNRVR